MTDETTTEVPEVENENVYTPSENPSNDQAAEDQATDEQVEQPLQAANSNVVYMSTRQMQQYLHENPDASVRALSGKPKTDRRGRGRPTTLHRYMIT